MRTIRSKCAGIALCVSLMLVTPSFLACDADQTISRITRSIDDAIAALNQNSAEWQYIMNRLITQLEGIDSQLASLIQVEVQNLLGRAVAVVGAELRCNIDFIGNRLRDALIRIKTEYLGYDPALGPLRPYICQVVPERVDRLLIPGRLDALDYYGYDFDLENVILYVENTNGTRTNITRHLVKPTHYHMYVNLGPGELELTRQNTTLVLTCGFEDLSYVNIIQGSTESKTITPGRRTYVPPHTRGDRIYGNRTRVEVSCSVELTATLFSGVSELRVRIYMKAEETGPDYTTAEGSETYVLFTAPAGKKIKRIDCAPYDELLYLDSDTNEDVFERGIGTPVLRYKCMGKAPGDVAAGSQTRVIVEFNPITIELEAL